MLYTSLFFSIENILWHLIKWMVFGFSGLSFEYWEDIQKFFKRKGHTFFQPIMFLFLTDLLCLQLLPIKVKKISKENFIAWMLLFYCSLALTKICFMKADTFFRCFSSRSRNGGRVSQQCHTNYFGFLKELFSS